MRQGYADFSKGKVGRGGSGVEQSDWHNLYGGGWQNIITPEAFSHPAKFSRKLVEHIFDHAIEQGWLKEGDTVIDPFAGVALGAWAALPRGINFLGVELEEKFVGLGLQNLALWDKRYRGKMPKWGRGILVQGDSRKLGEVLAQGWLDGCVSSPPWQTSLTTKPKGDYGLTEQGLKEDGTKWGGSIVTGNYGSHPAQLGNMREGELLDACVSSPPFMEAQTGGGIAAAMQGRSDYKVDKHLLTTGSRVQGYQAQGDSEGQLAAMPEGRLDGCVSSPPWYGTTPESGDPNYAHKFHGDQSQYAESTLNLHNELTYMSPEWVERRKQEAKQQGNISRLPAEAVDPDYPTFWSAARQIVAQVYAVLKPGAAAIWVVKSFVRKKKLVDFPGQWRQLCESVGFVTVHQHRAWLVEDQGTQFALIGDDKRNVKKRYSFFRRLHASKYPHLEIQWEVVLCMVKPTLFDYAETVQNG